MPSTGHMPTCYRSGGFPREGSMRPGTVSLFSGGWEAGMWVCFLLGYCLPFEGIAKWCLGILSSGNTALKVEAVLTWSLPQPWWGPCQCLHTATGPPPISETQGRESLSPSLGLPGFLCLGLAWMDCTWTDSRSPRQMQAAAFPWGCEFWEVWSTFCCGAWALSQPVQTTWVSALDPFILSILAHFEMHQTPWMGNNDADEDTRPSQGVGDYHYIEYKLGIISGTSHQKTVFFLFHSFVFHCFHNDWDDPSDHITIIMKETHLWLGIFGASEAIFCCLIGKSFLILLGDECPLVCVDIMLKLASESEMLPFQPC